VKCTFIEELIFVGEVNDLVRVECAFSDLGVVDVLFVLFHEFRVFPDHSAEKSIETLVLIRQTEEEVAIHLGVQMSLDGVVCCSSETLGELMVAVLQFGDHVRQPVVVFDSLAGEDITGLLIHALSLSRIATLVWSVPLSHVVRTWKKSE